MPQKDPHGSQPRGCIYTHVMLADRALHLAIRNFSTLVLVAAMVTVPLHLTYSIIFRDVIAVGEIHEQIETVGPGRKVRNVGAGELRDSRTAYIVLIGLELIALPFLIRATRRVIEDDEEGLVPSAWKAWSRAWSGSWLPRGGRDVWTAIAIGVALGAIVGFLTERALLLLVRTLEPDVRFIADGAVRGLAHAIGAPFGMVPLALGTRARDRGLKVG
jgi:hypothetical protein